VDSYICACLTLDTWCDEGGDSKAMIIELEGDSGTGKSTFLYTGITPMVVFAFDAGAVRALYGSKHEWFADRDVEIVKYPVPEEELGKLKSKWKRSPNAITVHLLPQPLQTGIALQGVQRLWNTFMTMWNMAKDDPEIPTVGVDTMTIARRVAADCHLEYMQATPLKPGERMRQNLIQVEWGKPGDMIRTMYTQAANQSESFIASGVQKHFIFTHHLQEVRVNSVDSQGNPTSHVQYFGGKPLKEMEGLHNTDRFMDVCLRVEQIAVDHPTIKGSKIIAVEGTYLKCGYNLSLKGTKVLMGTWDQLAVKLNEGLHPIARIQLRDA
jgi:hypothetical protein